MFLNQNVHGDESAINFMFFMETILLKSWNDKNLEVMEMMHKSSTKKKTALSHRFNFRLRNKQSW